MYRKNTSLSSTDTIGGTFPKFYQYYQKSLKNYKTIMKKKNNKKKRDFALKFK